MKRYQLGWLLTPMFLVGFQTPLSLAAAPKVAVVDPPAAEELAKILTTMMKSNMPNPLVEQSFNWGQQKNVPVGIRWEKRGILLKPETIYKLHNDGIWRKIRLEADDPDKNLKVLVQDVQSPGPGKLTFTMNLSLPTNIRFEQQLWVGGKRLYSGETRARCMGLLQLKCESISKAEIGSSFLPEVTFRMRVLEAHLNYDNLVVEHTLGVGGDLAQVIGDAVIDVAKQWRPSLERQALERANKAIIKAGDTKEMKLGLGKLLESKK